MHQIQTEETRMKDSEDELTKSLYWEACRITGMICLNLADRGQQTDRNRLIRELVTLVKASEKENEVCNPSLIFAIEQLRGDDPDEVRLHS